MSKRPVLEEVGDDDIDNMEMDIAQFDPSLNTPIAPLRPKPEIVRSQDQENPLFPGISTSNSNIAQKQTDRKNIIDPSKFSQEERENLKHFQHIYPCYFDKNRSHKEGRRVSEKNAVENPLAKTISDACRRIGLPVILELDKTHPQDFGNPGRVRVLLTNPETKLSIDSRYGNKRALMNEVSKYLKDHPTTLESVGAKSGIPYPEDLVDSNYEPCEIPKVKGFKMNTIVPVHSNLSIKHPMTKSIYDPEPAQPQIKAPHTAKQPKIKVKKIRG